MQLRNLPTKKIYCGNKILDLSYSQVMGILNATPDSFSDGGHYNSVDKALWHVEKMLDEGASIIDIGGESTRPHAAQINLIEEMDRVVPIVEAVAQRFDVILSIDTSSPEVMFECAKNGAHIWNDVRALKRPLALETAAKLDIPIVLMHMRGEPNTMVSLAQYHHMMPEIIDELEHRLNSALDAGIRRDNIILDPGFGFAKTTQHNLALLNQFYQLTDYFQLPLLSGLSRKRFLGEVLDGAETHERVYAGLAGHLLCVQQGASIIRTHDVLATVQHLKLWQAMTNCPT